MPNIRSAAKRMRQNARRRTANRGKRAAMRTAVKKLASAIDQGDTQTAASLLPATVSVIGKLAQQGLIAKNNAARHISRLSKKVHALSVAKSSPA
jgi:small subunit ribosomal protein S20